MTIRVKRVYDDPSPNDGRRVLVDRYWPRGLSREAAALDAWERDLAPTPDVIRDFGHRPERWAAFRDAYRAQLAAQPPEHLRALAQGAVNSTLTLLFAARDPEHNNAQVLAEYLGDLP